MEDTAPLKSAVEDNTLLVAEHYNSLEDKGLNHRAQSRILYLRNFNNWVKGMLIREYLYAHCTVVYYRDINYYCIILSLNQIKLIIYITCRGIHE